VTNSIIVIVEHTLKRDNEELFINNQNRHQ
jgi:hypothetical protein